ncbi:MAG: S-methyl-5'-thioadenosine phosphorylase [Anaerolineales bacterium]|nr:S-methyl-5'-thioadenosine phosphorylase [Anaerolineales bacterium]
MSSPPLFAVIGGSGLYDVPGLTQIREHWLDTPFGKPSGPIIQGEIHGEQVLFLARHGKGHPINPSQVNYRANIYGLKKLGVNRVISVNACGSLREDFKPGDLVIPTQLFDFTKGRKNTFFEDGFAAHVGVADPFCPDLSEYLYQALHESEATVHNHGTFIIIEGPRFSTRSESNTFRSWGMDIIGMTSAPEAFLAREAELCYASIAHVTDYDVWHSREEAVSVDLVLKIIKQNTTYIKESISNLAESPPAEERSCGCLTALETALITNPEVIPPDTRTKLGLLVSKYLEEKPS